MGQDKKTADEKDEVGETRKRFFFIIRLRINNEFNRHVEPQDKVMIGLLLSPIKKISILLL